MKPWLALLPCALAAACTEKVDQPERTQSLAVAVRLPGGQPLPAPGEPPLPLPAGNADLEFDVQALRPDGSPDDGFEGFVRVSVVPGAVVEVSGDAAQGRNVLLLGGKAANQRVKIRNPRGKTRLWVEDIGYIPDDPAKPRAPTASTMTATASRFFQRIRAVLANDNTENGGTYVRRVPARALRVAATSETCRARRHDALRARIGGGRDELACGADRDAHRGRRFLRYRRERHARV
ncbi:MAG: hypothetical protein U0263_14250 [Polyangiaceae bacterium]